MPASNDDEYKQVADKEHVQLGFPFDVEAYLHG